MANIASKVAQIRQAVYGKDVRESIASGIEAINTECEDTTGRQNVIDAQEQSRIDAENIRKTNETTRQNQEQTRMNNETTRQNQEQTRMNNETTRQNQEQTRMNNETTRQNQEQTRIDAFNINENARRSTFDSNENDRSVEFNGLKTQIIDATNNANNAVTNANQATSNYQSVVEQTKKIYKQSVDTFSSLSTTYPNPEIGWTVVTTDSNIEYRWDGVEWLSIGVGDTSSGYNVVVGPSAPDNPKSVWLEAPGEIERYARIIPSITEPTEQGQIWWELDN